MTSKKQKRLFTHAYVWSATGRSSVRMFWYTVIVGIFVSGGWYTVKAWHRMYELKDQVTITQEMIDKAEAENADLSTYLNSVSTDFMLERAARLDFNKTRPGEQVVILPDAETNIDVDDSIAKQTGPATWWEWVFPDAETRTQLAEDALPKNSISSR